LAKKKKAPWWAEGHSLWKNQIEKKKSERIRLILRGEGQEERIAPSKGPLQSARIFHWERKRKGGKVQ